MEHVKISEEQMVCRLLGIDNGTDKVGFTIADYNISTGKLDVILCETYETPSNYRVFNQGVYSRRGSLHARLDLIGEYFENLLEEYKPHLIGCESPFGFRMMNAFRTLTISMQMLDDIAYVLLPDVDFIKISPFEAKKAAAGDRKFSQDKDVNHQYVKDNKDIVFKEGIVVDDLGPDALDSVTVALAIINYVVY